MEFESRKRFGHGSGQPCGLAERRAATAIEYALVAGAIALAIVGIIGTIGDDVRELFYLPLLNLF